MLEGPGARSTGLRGRKGFLLHRSHHCLSQLPKEGWGKLGVGHNVNKGYLPLLQHDTFSRSTPSSTILSLSQSVVSHSGARLFFSTNTMLYLHSVNQQYWRSSPTRARLGLAFKPVAFTRPRHSFVFSRHSRWKPKKESAVWSLAGPAFIKRYVTARSRFVRVLKLMNRLFR
jgi:hypothetical protein